MVKQWHGFNGRDCSCEQGLCSLGWEIPSIPLSLLVYDVQEWTVLYFQRKLIKCEWRPSREPHWVVFLLCVCFMFCWMNVSLWNPFVSSWDSLYHGVLAQWPGKLGLMEWDGVGVGVGVGRCIPPCPWEATVFPVLWTGTDVCFRHFLIVLFKDRQWVLAFPGHYCFCVEDLAPSESVVFEKDLANQGMKRP